MAKKPVKTVRFIPSYRRQLFSQTFLDRTQSSVFTSGTYSISLRKLARDLDCPFPHSARRLQHILDAAGIKSLQRLFSIGLHGLSSLAGVGDSICDVATVILEDAGFDLVAFCGWSEDETPVRFSTLKRQQKQQEKRRTLPADKAHLPSDFDDQGKTRHSLTH